MSTTTEVTVPDIGDFAEVAVVAVIEVHVAAGDAVAADDPLITLESDKATMDIPAPAAGTVAELRVGIGDKVGEGSTILLLTSANGAVPAEQQEPAPAPAPTATPTVPAPTAPAPAAVPAPAAPAAVVADFATVHAGPSVRRLARELGVDLGALAGTGAKGRITKDDVLAFLRGPSTAPAPAATAGIPAIPAVDFAKFGPITTRPLPRIKKISGPFLHRSWLNVPHVTHHDEADITELEAYRKELDTKAKAEGYRITLLAFLLKAATSALKAFPEVNSSLTPEGDALVCKDYQHIGIAVDTPEGLVVPVIRDVDRKGITTLSQELGAVSAKARDGKLGPADMSGGTFTISSLGGIGGTSFTPIVNAPEVAILGVVRAKMAPVWTGEAFTPRLMLPLSLSYDHRVIDGALAARFTRHLAHVLEDVRRLVL